MTKLNFLRSKPSLLLTGALVGLTLGACDLGPKMIGDETQGAEDCEDGESKPAGDGCNTCTCSDGGWACTEIACEGQTSSQTSGPAMCQDGDMMPAGDGCNTCTCFEGDWHCTLLACEPGETDSGPGTTTVATSATSGETWGDTEGDTDSEPPPVIPCEGEAVPLADIPTIVAYTQAQVPPVPDTTGGSGSSGSSGGGELEPGTIFVKLSNQGFVCADPNANLQCGGNWELTLVIPPEYQSPGTYNLLGPDVRGFGTETGDEGGNDCSFGGGTVEGSFQIFSVDDNTVEGRLCHVNHFFSAPVPALDGSFSAPRCPG